MRQNRLGPLLILLGALAAAPVVLAQDDHGHGDHGHGDHGHGDHGHGDHGHGDHGHGDHGHGDHGHGDHGHGHGDGHGDGDHGHGDHGHGDHGHGDHGHGDHGHGDHGHGDHGHGDHGHGDHAPAVVHGPWSYQGRDLPAPHPAGERWEMVPVPGYGHMFVASAELDRELVCAALDTPTVMVDRATRERCGNMEGAAPAPAPRHAHDH